MSQNQSLQPSLDVASLLGGSSQYVSLSIHCQEWVSQIDDISLSLASSNTGLRHSTTSYQTIRNPTLVTLTPKISTKLKRTSSTDQTRELADHRNSELFYRRRSLHEMRERELILKGGCTKDGTTIPEEEGRPKLTQQPTLETPRRPTI